VLGTHTHEPTIPMHMLPGGTGFVTDVGMTGPVGGVQGFGFDIFVTALRAVDDPFAFGLPTPLDGDIVLGAVVLEITGTRATALRRLTQWPLSVPCRRRPWLTRTARGTVKASRLRPYRRRRGV